MTDRDWQDLLLQRDKTIDAIREDNNHNIEQCLKIAKERDDLRSGLSKAKEYINKLYDSGDHDPEFANEIEAFLNQKS